MQLPLFTIGVAKEHSTEIFEISTLMSVPSIPSDLPEPSGHAQPGPGALRAHQGSPRQRAAGHHPRHGDPVLVLQREVDAGDQAAEPEEVTVHP